MTKLLKDGYPYEAIMQFSVSEINLILAIENSISERQQEQQDRLNRAQQAQRNFR